MSTIKNSTLKLPPRLAQLGFTQAQLQALANRWFIISLYQQGKISAAEAGEMSGSDGPAFLAQLERLNIADGAASDFDIALDRPLAELAQTQQQITELKSKLAKSQKELTKVKQALSQSDKARSDFIATVSHELRTPLNSVIGFAKLLLNQQVGPLNQIQQTDLSLIYDSAQHLLNLVNNILDLSKIDAQKIGLNIEWVSVEEIIVGVIASTYILIEDKPINLTDKIEPHLPQIYVDRGRIRQVVINLLSNAAKFTDVGTITLRVFKVVENEQDWVCFSVEDTGIGIKEEDMPKVFEPFRQIDSSVSRRAEGTGLGMPISYRLVKLHGGELRVNSRFGQGSTFSFTLPVVPPAGLDLMQADYRLT